VKETIAEMLKVEARAKDIVAKAQDEAAGIVRQARVEAARLQEEAQRTAQAEAAKLVELGIEDARKHRDELLARIDKENERLRDVGHAKADEAKKLIIAALTGM